jgi:hypothetical protein
MGRTSWTKTRNPATYDGDNICFNVEIDKYKAQELIQGKISWFKVYGSEDRSRSIWISISMYGENICFSGENDKYQAMDEEELIRCLREATENTK